MENFLLCSGSQQLILCLNHYSADAPVQIRLRFFFFSHGSGISSISVVMFWFFLFVLVFLMFYLSCSGLTVTVHLTFSEVGSYLQRDDS